MNQCYQSQDQTIQDHLRNGWGNRDRHFRPRILSWFRRVIDVRAAFDFQKLRFNLVGFLYSDE